MFVSSRKNLAALLYYWLTITQHADTLLYTGTTWLLDSPMECTLLPQTFLSLTLFLELTRNGESAVPGFLVCLYVMLCPAFTHSCRSLHQEHQEHSIFSVLVFATILVRSSFALIWNLPLLVGLMFLYGCPALMLTSEICIEDIINIQFNFNFIR